MSKPVKFTVRTISGYSPPSTTYVGKYLVHDSGALVIFPEGEGTKTVLGPSAWLEVRETTEEESVPVSVVLHP